MKILKSIFPALGLFLLLSCSDGTQVGQKIKIVIKEKKLKKVEIISEKSNDRNMYILKKITIEDQFIIVGDEYINLGRVKTFKAVGDKLEILI